MKERAVHGRYDSPDVTQEIVIVQITAAAGDPNVLYALANDGSVWRLSVRLGYGWARLPGLPEPPGEPEDPNAPVVTPSTPI